MILQLKLVLRYLGGRKLRTTLTTLAVTLGVALLFGMNSVLPSMLQAFQRNMLTAAGEVDMAVTSSTSGPFSAGRLDAVRGVEGVADASGSLSQAVSLPTELTLAPDSAGPVTSLTLVGLDPGTAPYVHSYVIDKGSFLPDGDTSAMLVPQTLAEKAGLDTGSRVTLPSAAGTADFHVVGIVTVPPIPGQEQVFVSLPAAQALLDLPGQITEIDIMFKAGADRATVEKAIVDTLGSGFQAGTITSGSSLLTAAKVGQSVFALFGAIALAMGVFIIFNTFRTIVLERRHDLGMLRAVGAGRRTILGLMIGESIVQGLMGTAAGLLLGYGLAAGIMAWLGPFAGQFMHIELPRPIITTGNLVGSIAVGLGITLLGGLLPALSASRVTPLEALRPVSATTFERTARRRSIVGVVLVILATAALATGQIALAALGTLLFLAGLILLAPGLTLPLTRVFGRLLGLAFAREGRIAEGNLIRQPNRAAITASVLMIGLAFCIAMAGVITSVRDGFVGYLNRSLGSDLLVMPSSLVLSGGNVGAAPDLARQIAQTPGIQGVTTLRLGMSRFESRGLKGSSSQALQVVGIDPQTYAQISGLVFSQGSPDEAFPALGSERAVIVNGITAAQTGIKLGDTLPLQTPEGVQTYRVVGIANDYLNAKLATAYTSQGNLARDFHATADLLIMADLKPGADEPAVRDAIGRLVANYPAFSLIEWKSFRQSQMAVFGKMIGLLYALIVLFSIPALMAMINTLVINVMERTREIGVLRAMGSTRRQVGRMIRAESLLLAAIGTAFGIVAGIWLGYVLVQAMNAAGFPMSYFFPAGGILLTIATGLIIGVLAANIPARRAARMDIITALRYE